MKRTQKITALLLTILIGMTMFSVLPVEAGMVARVIDTTSYTEQLNESVWYNADEDITVQNGVIIFPENSSSATKLITKNAMKVATQTDMMLEVNFTVDFTSLPEGEHFAFVMGLQSLTAELGQKGNIELAFSNVGGMRKASVSAYVEDDVEEKLLQSVSCNNGKVKVAVEVSTRQSLNISIDGKKVYSGTIPVSGEGSVGFLQTGSCGAKVSDCILKSYDYETPECPNVVEDFESGFFNSNLLYATQHTATGYLPCHMKIEDYNGSKVLMFKNIGRAYFGTKYAYSNFELTFDVPYFEGKTEVDKDGKVVQPASNSFGVAYGQDGIVHTGSAYTAAADTFIISRDLSGYRIRNNEKFSFGRDIDPSNVPPFSVRLTVIDGLVTLSMKLMQETTWQETVSYRLDEMFSGNIIVWAPSGNATTFAIDNFKVVNKDVDGKIIDVEYKSSEITVPDDFKYESLGLEYNPKAANNNEAKETWYRPVMIVTGICLLSLGITVITSIVKQKKGRDKQ